MDPIVAAIVLFALAIVLLTNLALYEVLKVVLKVQFKDEAGGMPNASSLIEDIRRFVVRIFRAPPWIP